MILKILMILPLVGAIGFGYDKRLEEQKKATGIDLPVSEWKLPTAMQEDGYIDPNKMPKDSKYSQMVILGNKILNQTTKYIGPQAKDPSKRYARNNLSCSSCHALGGTKQNQSGFVGITARFPQYNSRGDKVITLEDRINGCMQRSMNGKPLPRKSTEMVAMVTYMQFLSQGVLVGAKTKGQGLPSIGYLDRAASPDLGKIVYDDKCQICHGVNGEGIKNFDANGDYYLFPPLWGKDSYNTGAGMYRLIKCASYVKANMPQNDATLSIEDAYDVCAYINIQDRPTLKNREADFPDRRVKPVDVDVPPYGDNFSTKQHRFGPYKDMIK